MASIYSKYFERDKQFKPKLHSVPPPINGKMKATQSTTQISKNLKTNTGISTTGNIKIGSPEPKRDSAGWSKPKAVLATSMIPNGALKGHTVDSELQRRSKSPAATRDIFRKSLQKSFEDVDLA